ncbi:uncharacterized protein [Onthophagus taurus]|uniref:uncharacterized protein n=1 Tax=Onthophagus taurus TaxID=166361 RepID=UPI0039BEACB9
MSISTEQETKTNLSPKKKQFNRNPSLEKIINFNAYICSQNFFILPALLTWMKTSQSILQAYSEKCTNLVKNLIKLDFLTIIQDLNKMGKETKRKLLEISTYTCLFLVFLQLTTCLILLGINSMPGGLIFLLVSISYICYMNYLCLRLIILKQKYKDEQKNFENEATTKYIRPKDILGKRTISSLNLF